MDKSSPAIVVLSVLFPHAGQPQAGLFIRERLFRVGKLLPILVVSPKPWFPGQHLVQKFKKGYRPNASQQETQQGINVLFPHFFSLPAVLRSWDGLFLALSVYPLFKRLKKQGKLDIIDAHFAYPDGYAAAKLGHWLNVPVTITLRGTEPRYWQCRWHRPRLLWAMNNASRIFSVSESLRQQAIAEGIDAYKISVVGNGVDTSRFFPLEKSQARQALGIPQNAKVLISVGGLVERKGFHRVLEILPALKKEHPDLLYLIVGGDSAEGNWRDKLEQLCAEKKLGNTVRFLGALPPDDLRQPLSAADVFVLATSNEGWANVFLEAMAVGLPVVTTAVGGNKEVVCEEALGSIIPFGDPDALYNAVLNALGKNWNRTAIIDYAKKNAWDERVQRLYQTFCQLYKAGAR